MFFVRLFVLRVLVCVSLCLELAATGDRRTSLTFLYLLASCQDFDVSKLSRYNDN